MSNKYRLVTRSDFDGLVCAVLFKELDMIDDIIFVHPKDMQDGLIQITNRDITTNLPYVEGVYMAFDHHESETIRVKNKPNQIIEKNAPSAARVVYNYYSDKLGDMYAELLTAVDKGDSADFTEEEVLYPEKWNLLNFIMDARTGLGRFKNFRISNYQLMIELIDSCKTMTVDEILQLPDVKERVDLYFKYENDFRNQLERCSSIHDNVLVIDLRDEEIIYPGNRFIVYTMFPEINISIHVIWGLNKQNTVFAVGKSIFNKSSVANIGAIMLEHGGGGHASAGTCQVANINAARIQEELINIFKDKDN